MSNLQSLSSLHPGQTATVKTIYTDNTGFHLQLNALGMKLGKQLLVIRIAPLNGPMHLLLGNTEVMLRQDDANMIEVLV